MDRLSSWGPSNIRTAKRSVVLHPTPLRYRHEITHQSWTSAVELSTRSCLVSSPASLSPTTSYGEYLQSENKRPATSAQSGCPSLRRAALRPQCIHSISLPEPLSSKSQLHLPKVIRLPHLQESHPLKQPPTRQILIPYPRPQIAQT